MKKLCMMIVAAAGLSACGGGSSFNGQVGTPNAFTSAVLELIGTTSETGEPVAIEAFTLLMPENTEPVAVN